LKGWRSQIPSGVADICDRYWRSNATRIIWWQPVWAARHRVDWGVDFFDFAITYCHASHVPSGGARGCG